MKSIERRWPQEADKSFMVIHEVGTHFPYPWHYHPEYELVLICKSTGRRMVGDHIGYFEDGDLVFIGSLLPHVSVNDPHFVRGEAGCQAEAIVIQFVEDFLGQEFLQTPEMAAFRHFLYLSGRGMVIQGRAREQVSAIMVEMLHMEGLQRLISLLSIFDILAHTTEYELLASPGYVHDTSLKSSRHFSRINEYIMRNFQRDISLPEIAGAVNMTVATFCKFFKEHYRVTFIEYLTSVKVGHACKLLAENDFNIMEAAYGSGFNNLANFYKQFKKLKQMTPSEYRRTLQV
ncbi:MAG: AraC family transcriptional regulator [Adhaeribacter sp.]